MATPPLEHLVSLLLAPFTDAGSRTFWPGLALTALVAAWFARGQPWRASWTQLRALTRHPSTRLDVQLLLARQLLRGLRGVAATGGAFAVAAWIVLRLDHSLGAPAPLTLSPAVLAVVYSLTLFIAWDASRFAAHWLMHKLPFLWAFHQVHHSAERLSPLTFHRVHPVESLIYDLRGALTTGAVAGLFFWLTRGQAEALTLLGVPALGLALNVLTGNLRHSELWVRFPPAVEGWLMSPAQHQLHHSAAPEHVDKNLGTWLACWDRLAGSLVISESPPLTFGLPAGERNHRDDLLSAMFGPFVGAAKALVGPRALAALGLFTAQAVQAQDPEETPAEPAEETPPRPRGEGVGAEILIYAEDGTPRVAGSAHRVDEETLERFEYDNVERVLAEVPGVSTRGEDGYGLRPNIGMRGASSDRSAKVTLMEDGVLFAPAPYAAPAAYYFPMSTRLVGVEVFKGPAATRFGPQTVGGAINLLTRRAPVGLDYGLDLAGGQYRSGKAAGYLGFGNERAGLLIDAAQLSTAGFKELDGGGPTGFQRGEMMVKGRLRLGAEGVLELKLGLSDETSHETYLGLSASDYAEDPLRRYAASANDLMRWTRTQAELSWSAPLGEQGVTRTVLYHHYLTRSWTRLDRFNEGPDLHDLLQTDPSSGQGALYLSILRGDEDSASLDDALALATNDRRFHSAGLQSTARWSVGGETIGSDLELGLRLHIDSVARVHTQDLWMMTDGALVRADAPTTTTLDSDAWAQAIAAHVHEDLRIGAVHVLPGLRAELIRSQRIDVGAEVLPPRLAGILLPGIGALAPLGPWLDVFAGSTRGFSPASPGDPVEVKPETAWSNELGLRHHQGARHAELVGFFNAYQNLTGQCTLSGGCLGDDIDRQFNGGAAWISGVELVAGSALFLPDGSELSGQATYSYTRARFQTGFVSGFPQFGDVSPGDSLPYVPEHQASARLVWSHRVIDVGVGGSFRSGMLDKAGTFPVTEADVPPLFLLDASLSAQATERLRVYATGTNLTRSDALVSWRPFGARPTAPMTIMVGLKVGPPEPKDEAAVSSGAP